MEQRYPTKLSGGQQQRVSFARAVVAEPRALLFDEPLSNLDAKLRERMRFEIVELQKKLNVTTIYVTHDQAEAMVIADKIAVMNCGLIMQIGNPREIYENPENKFIAGFIGFTNFIAGRVLRRSPDQKFWVLDCPEIKAEIYGICSKPLQLGQEVELSVRPEHIQIFPTRPKGPLNRLKGKLSVSTYLGEYNDCMIRVREKLIRVKANPDLEISPDQNIDLYLNPYKLNILIS
jgi:iron(III) transport system ATP-binding protein